MEITGGDKITNNFAFINAPEQLKFDVGWKGLIFAALALLICIVLTIRF